MKSDYYLQGGLCSKVIFNTLANTANSIEPDKTAPTVQAGLGEG